MFGLNCSPGHLHPQMLRSLVASAQTSLFLPSHHFESITALLSCVREQKICWGIRALSCTPVQSCFWSAAVVEAAEGLLHHCHGLCVKLTEANGKMCLQAGPRIHRRLNSCFRNAKNS